MLDDQKKHEIFAMLLREAEPRDIADELGVGQGTVYRLRRELKEAQDKNDLESIMDVSRLVIRETARNLDIPLQETDKLIKGLDGLDNLDVSLQETALAINNKAKSMLLSADHISEVEMCADIICKLRNAFFGKAAQLNVQQNFGGEANGKPKYNQFLGDAPGS